MAAIASKCKRTLIIGDDFFSFADQYTKAHPERASGVFATSNKGEEETKACVEVENRLERLHALGVKLLFNLSPANFQVMLRGERFEKIQWNYFQTQPELYEGCRDKNGVMIAFFQSCSDLQIWGDRVHLVLGQSDEAEGIKEQLEMNLPEAASMSGYALTKKCSSGLVFSSQTRDESDFGDQEAYEFIFEKYSVNLNSNYFCSESLRDWGQFIMRGTDGTIEVDSDSDCGYYKIPTDMDGSSSVSSSS